MPIRNNVEEKEDETQNMENGTANIRNYGHSNPKYLTDSNRSLSPDNNYSSKIIVSSNENIIENENNTRELIESNITIPRDPQLWRDLLAFWFLGLCNNYGYVVMLSAAHDIIGKFDDNTHDSDSVETTARECHIMSTGAILLADIIPALMIKIVAPFVPLWINVRVVIANLLTVAGFLLVGYSENQWTALLGVICTSLSSGLGEATFLGYSSRFNRDVISTWSSGTGGAGVGGSISYAALRLAGVSPVTTMLILLIVPLIECIAFWIVLRKPKKTLLLPPTDNSSQNDEIQKEIEAQTNINDNDKPLETLKEKLYYILYLLKYVIPLTIVYVAEYFINQGLYELVNFKNTSMDKGTQYRWLNVVYQIGVFISRSSVNLVTIDKIWIFPMFQLLNVVYFLNEVIFYVTPMIWITFLIVLFEGLLGGGAYVNTFYKMSKEIPKARRQFALAFVSISDSTGITLAGFLAIPVHNAICNIPEPDRLLL